MKSLVLSVFVFFLICNTSIAQEWSGDTKVKQIFTHEGAGAIYYNFDSMINPDNCTNPGQIALLKDSIFQKEIFSLFQAAYMANKTVRYLINGCTTNGYPHLTNAILK